MENAFNKKLSKILDEIAEKYNLDAEILKTQYIPSASAQKKRGRRKKKTDEIIEMTEYIYENEKFLIDAKNTVYTFEPESPLVIGEKLIDGTIKFNHNYQHKSCNL
jgi:hypothetical protein